MEQKRERNFKVTCKRKLVGSIVGSALDEKRSIDLIIYTIYNEIDSRRI